MLAAFVSDRDNYWSGTLVDFAVFTLMQDLGHSCALFYQKLVFWCKIAFLKSRDHFNVCLYFRIQRQKDRLAILIHVICHRNKERQEREMCLVKRILLDTMCRV